jgi:hypothetical protein
MVEGPAYPSEEGLLCAECGEEMEAAHWHKVMVDRDGGVS